MELFDYIIVGAGSAGCVLANRLTADPSVRVLLLEAGGKDDHPRMPMPLAWLPLSQDPTVNWNYVGEPEPHADGRQIVSPRGKVLGGSSSINGGMYIRGMRADYDDWATYGVTGWSYAEVLPYFKRAETSWRGKGPYHGDSGPLTVERFAGDAVITPHLMRTAEALGYTRTDDFSGAQPEGVGLPDLTTHRGRRGSTSKRYLDPVRSRSNLEVRTHALASRLLLENGRATGVAYDQGGVARQAGARREVILAGGAFNSPQLLMLSGIGPARELAAMGIEPVVDLPGVGRNLQDHGMIFVVYPTRQPITFDNQLRLDRMAWSLLRWHLFGSGPVAGAPFAFQGFLKTRPELAWANLQMQVTTASFGARLWHPLWRKGAGHFLSVGGLLLDPESKGSVTLRSADYRDKPRITYNYLAAERDRAEFRLMLKLMRRFFSTAPASSLVGPEMLPGAALNEDDVAAVDAYVRQVITTTGHPTSTCAMGKGPMAVLDSELKVHGVQGLRVADAAAFPVIMRGNTNAPTIMLAEKASDLIAAAVS